MTGLNTQLSLLTGGKYPTYSVVEISGNYYLDLDMCANYFDDIFYFKTTFPDLESTTNDASDVAYYCNPANLPDIFYSLGRISNRNRTDIDTFLVDKITKFIGPAWLAKNITGGYNNSDLFDNEDELIRQYVNFDGIDYRFVRVVIPDTVDTSTNSTPISGASVGIQELQFFINDASLSYPIDISAVTASSYTIDPSNVLSDTSYWLSDGSYNRDPSFADILLEDPSINIIPTIYGGSEYTPYVLNKGDISTNITGEWLQVEFKENVSLTEIKLRPVTAHIAGINDNSGSTPHSLAIFTSVDGTNWTLLSEKTNIGLADKSDNSFNDANHYRTYSLPNIKQEIRTVLDASGGSLSAPLSNADQGSNNISREIINNMLDSNNPDIVQRVHTMISKSIDISANAEAQQADNPANWIPIKFGGGDQIEFNLVYDVNGITDTSDVALDSNGRRLGSNTVENQDFCVRINMLPREFVEGTYIFTGPVTDSDKIGDDPDQYYNIEFKELWSNSTSLIPVSLQEENYEIITLHKIDTSDPELFTREVKIHARFDYQATTGPDTIYQFSIDDTLIDPTQGFRFDFAQAGNVYFTFPGRNGSTNNYDRIERGGHSSGTTLAFSAFHEHIFTIKVIDNTTIHIDVTFPLAPSSSQLWTLTGLDLNNSSTIKFNNLNRKAAGTGLRSEKAPMSWEVYAVPGN